MHTDITYIDTHDFPPLLREIPDPPDGLYMQGTFPPPEFVPLCVVGARRCTSYGLQACEKLIGGLRGYPIVIVSGLALGIDGRAHRAALDAGLPTIAIPGSGLDPSALYPRSNVPLAERIVASDGALLSEFKPLFRARPESFPQRNRIMAGMSRAVLVVEAERKSGTLITARLALDYNRDVLAVPGSIFSAMSSGPNYLLETGAAPITTSEDILKALGFHSGQKTSADEVLAGCSEEERAVLAILCEPLTRDALIRRLGLPTSAANVLLASMELKDLLAERGGLVYGNI
jgi:DNA processing protein